EDVTQTGNRYLFSFQPTLTFAATDYEKTYGTEVTQDTLNTLFTVSGFPDPVGGAFLKDTIETAFSGLPEITSLGAPANAPVSGSPYYIVIESLENVTSDAGYLL